MVDSFMFKSIQVKAGLIVALCTIILSLSGILILQHINNGIEKAELSYNIAVESQRWFQSMYHPDNTIEETNDLATRYNVWLIRLEVKAKGE